MTDAVAIAGAASTTALAVMLVVVVAWLRSEVSRRGDAQDAQRQAEQRQAQAERDRDDARAQATQAQAERDDSRRQAASISASLAAAREELTKHVKDTLANGTDADVAAEVDRLLQSPLPAVHPAPAPAGVDQRKA